MLPSLIVESQKMRSRPEEAEEDKEGRQILFHFGWCGVVWCGEKLFGVVYSLL